jgi:glycosyltransferase involved in cell wall biosynthesis
LSYRVLICRANPLAPDPRVDKIARTLKKGGYIVTLVGWNMSGEYPPAEEVDGIRIYRLPVRAIFGRGLVNILHQVRWQVALLVWLVRHRSEFDLIHACDFDTLLATLVCKAFCRKKVIYDIFDFYADMLRLTPQPVKGAIRFVDLRAIGAADALILADDSRYQQIQGAHPKRSIVIYNALDDLVGASQRLAPHGFADSLRIAYIGNIQLERGLLELLEVLRRHPEWRLDLAGFGGDETQITALAQQLSNVTWHGRVPYATALQLSQSADVLIATYDPAILNNRYASPNKVFEAMMLGKPIIVARGTNMDRMIESANCGLVVKYGDSQELEAAFSQLKNDPLLRHQLGENARQVFESTYNWGIMEKRLLALYEELL